MSTAETWMYIAEDPQHVDVWVYVTPHADQADLLVYVTRKHYHGPKVRVAAKEDQARAELHRCR